MATTDTPKHTDKAKLGFLDLPTEIRLEIYHLLLHATSQFKLCLPAYQFHEPTPISLQYITRKVNPTSIYANYPETKYRIWAPLYPQILSTCRIIHDEAVPMLYRDNEFSISSSDGVEEEDDAFLEIPTLCEVEKACEKLMSYGIDDAWDDDKTILPSIRTSHLAAFLRVIGPRNAGQIRSLEYRTQSPNDAADDLSLATALCAHHMPSLNTFTLHVQEKRITAHGLSADYFHPDFHSPFWTNGPLWPMYTALKEFVRRVEWLKVLDYSEGWANGQVDWPEKGDLHRIHVLEAFVLKRTKGREEGREGGEAMDWTLLDDGVGGTDSMDRFASWQDIRLPRRDENRKLERSACLGLGWQVARVREW